MFSEKDSDSCGHSHNYSTEHCKDQPGPHIVQLIQVGAHGFCKPLVCKKGGAKSAKCVFIYGHKSLLIMHSLNNIQKAIFSEFFSCPTRAAFFPASAISLVANYNKDLLYIAFFLFSIFYKGQFCGMQNEQTFFPLNGSSFSFLFINFINWAHKN